MITSCGWLQASEENLRRPDGVPSLGIKRCQRRNVEALWVFISSEQKRWGGESAMTCPPLPMPPFLTSSLCQSHGEDPSPWRPALHSWGWATSLSPPLSDILGSSFLLRVSSDDDVMTLLGWSHDAAAGFSFYPKFDQNNHRCFALQSSNIHLQMAKNWIQCLPTNLCSKLCFFSPTCVIQTFKVHKSNVTKE